MRQALRTLTQSAIFAAFIVVVVGTGLMGPIVWDYVQLHRAGGHATLVAKRVITPHATDLTLRPAEALGLPASARLVIRTGANMYGQTYTDYCVSVPKYEAGMACSATREGAVKWGRELFLRLRMF
jgi:hypothetical protein